MSRFALGWIIPLKWNGYSFDKPAPNDATAGVDLHFGGSFGTFISTPAGYSAATSPVSMMLLSNTVSLATHLPPIFLAGMAPDSSRK